MLDIVASYHRIMISYHRIMVSYHHVQYQQKLMIQSWENLATEGQIDRGTDKSDFIGHCSTNVERLIINMEHISNSFCLLDPHPPPPFICSIIPPPCESLSLSFYFITTYIGLFISINRRCISWHTERIW